MSFARGRGAIAEDNRTLSPGVHRPFDRGVRLCHDRGAFARTQEGFTVSTQTADQRPAVVLGLALIVLGLLLFAAQTLDLDFAIPVWPFFVIVPGAVLYFASFAVGREAGATVASLGALIATIGLILLYQQATDHWESWAYAWALLPAAVGFGLVSYGAVIGDERIQRGGWPPLTIGAVLFLIGAVFFEGVLGLGGPQNRLVGEWLLPVLLLVVGVGLVGRSLLSRR